MLIRTESGDYVNASQMSIYRFVLNEGSVDILAEDNESEYELASYRTVKEAQAALDALALAVSSPDVRRRIYDMGTGEWLPEPKETP